MSSAMSPTFFASSSRRGSDGGPSVSPSLPPSGLPAATAGTRAAVQPPQLWARESLWQTLAQWLRPGPVDTLPAPASEVPTVLKRAKEDFVQALGDVHCAEAADLLTRARHARSLRELWHLRAELYSIVARHRNQATADSRLALVNRHFPVRAARTPAAKD
jgi:hypothetical protein